MNNKQKLEEEFLKAVEKGRGPIAEEEAQKLSGWFESLMVTLESVQLMFEGMVEVTWDEAANRPKFTATERGKALAEQQKAHSKKRELVLN